jgi:hypothetical protein
MHLNVLKGFTTKLIRPQRLRRQPDHHGGDSHGEYALPPGLLRRPTREDILQCYRLILGREPENETTINEQMQYASVVAFRNATLKSIEFRGKYRALCADRPDPYWSNSRRSIAFIHLEKTGGTTLRDALAPLFEEDRVCPGPNNPIYSFSVAELGHYDFFAGHFDLDSVRYIPRRNISTIALFREPRSRLISWYRFHKSHPLDSNHAANRLVVLANKLTAEEFFESPEVRCSQLAYNRYLLAFGRSFAWFDHCRDSLSSPDLEWALQDAKSAIRSLNALGITEQFDKSVRYICQTLGLSCPATIKSVNVTDDLPRMISGFQFVEPVRMTSRLSSALDELTCYDEEVYKFAIGEFERRCTESGLS